MGQIASSFPQDHGDRKGIDWEPLRFHNLHGKNIELSTNQMTATQLFRDFGGQVFSHRPIHVDEKIYLRVSQVSRWLQGSLHFGFTRTDPKTLQPNLPQSPLDYENVSDVYVYTTDSKLPVNTVLHYHVKSNGVCHYGLNGANVGVFTKALSKKTIDTANGPLWAFIDLQGSVVAVDLVHFTGKLSNYVMEKGLGIGGFGAVVMARSDLTQEKCAIKMVSALFEEEVAKELEALRMLQHENIINCRRSWRDGLDSRTLTLIQSLLPKLPNTIKIPPGGKVVDVICMEMELCDGDLRGYLCKMSRSAADERFQIFEGILKGLAYIHEKQVIHRDMKPENVLIVRHPTSPSSMTVKIADVGLAKFAEKGVNLGVSLLLNTHGIGTPIYLAPEQMKGSKSYGRAVDIYPLGIVLFELLYEPCNQGAPQGREWTRWLQLIIQLTQSRQLPADLHCNTFTRQLIQDMTQSEPKSRPTATDILAQIHLMEF